ncbi:MAG: hypothetical protein ACOXZ4_04685 [Sphaerochaetaceae bacterium]
MILNLQQDITYTRLLDEHQMPQEAFDALLMLLETLEAGSEGLLAITVHRSSEMHHLLAKHSFARSTADEGASVGTLGKGSYLFIQLPYPLTEGAFLVPALYSFLLADEFKTQEPSLLYVRLYKESRFETAVQLMAPIQTTGE